MLVVTQRLFYLCIYIYIILYLCNVQDIYSSLQYWTIKINYIHKQWYPKQKTQLFYKLNCLIVFDRLQQIITEIFL